MENEQRLKWTASNGHMVQFVWNYQKYSTQMNGHQYSMASQIQCRLKVNDSLLCFAILKIKMTQEKKSISFEKGSMIESDWKWMNFNKNFPAKLSPVIHIPFASLCDFNLARIVRTQFYYMKLCNFRALHDIAQSWIWVDLFHWKWLGFAFAATTMLWSKSCVCTGALKQPLEHSILLLYIRANKTARTRWRKKKSQTVSVASSSLTAYFLVTLGCEAHGWVTARPKADSKLRFVFFFAALSRSFWNCMC